MPMEQRTTFRAPPAWSPGLKAFWIVVGGIVCLLWGLALLARLRPNPQELHDFAQEWTSARNFFTGHPIYLDLKRSVPVHFSGKYFGPVEINAHPPASVLLVLPFALLEYRAAYVVWNVVSLITLPISLWLLFRPAGLNLNRWLVLPVVALLLLSNSLSQQVNQGQLNLVLLLLTVVAWSADRTGKPMLAGVMVGLAAAIKLFPGFLVVYFVCQRKWRAVIAMAVTFVAVHAATLVLLGADCFRDYICVVLPRVGAFRDYWPNASITGFWYKLFDGSSAHGIPVLHAPMLTRTGTWLCSLAVVALTVWRCWKARQPNERSQAFAICVVAMLLLSPITWDHYFLLLLVPFAVLWKLLSPTSVNRGFLIGAIFVLTTVYPKWVWDASIPGDGELADRPGMVRSVATTIDLLTVVSYQFYALVGLFLFSSISRVQREETADDR
jgi:hypothetical protein